MPLLLLLLLRARAQRMAACPQWWTQGRPWQIQPPGRLLFSSPRAPWQCQLLTLAWRCLARPGCECQSPDLPRQPAAV